ncbi:MAG: FAD-binding oxidoreductase, partial [Chloroflexi bacterium]|nr:FAD-binding oxidoreductase [Chloroflexota bacterium]
MVPQRAAVVIIGGGVIGSSIAYYLTKKGCRDVVVLERHFLGSGSTSKAAGGIRQQFSTEVNVRLSQVSVQVFERFEQEFDRPADFRQEGYLFLLTQLDQVAQFRRNVAMQQRLGVDVRWLTPAQAGTLVPQLFLDDVLAATYCPTDGVADPYQVTQGFARRAAEQGARFLEFTEATGLLVRLGRVQGVRTTRGDITADTVVIAAGPWSAEVGRMAGVDLPILPYQQHVFVTALFADLPA